MSRTTAAGVTDAVGLVAEDAPNMTERAGVGLVRDCDWLEDAACRPADGDLFHTETEHHVSLAVRVCAGCAVQTECLAFALTHDERFGIWGGKTPAQRRKMAHADEVHSDDEVRDHHGSSAA